MTIPVKYQAQGTNPDDRWNDILGILKVQAQMVDLTYLDRQALIDAGIRDQEPSSSLEKKAL